MVNDFVPIIDLSDRHTPEGRDALAASIGDACATSGFYIITGHGVPKDLVDRMYRTTNAFFTLPDAVKDRVADGPGVSGFRRQITTAHSLNQKTPPDLCETFSTSVTGDLAAEEREALGDYWAPWKLPNSWPAKPADFHETWAEYAKVMADLAADLMRLSARALGVAEDFFSDKFDRHVSSLAANYYPPTLRPPLPGQMRRGPHSDFGGLTILYQQDDLGGLQVSQEGVWRDVPAIPGTFVVNIGDLMALWTGGRWVSTLHRVVPPERGNLTSRISIPFFYLPNHDVYVEPVAGDGGSPGLTAGEWISTQMMKIFAPTLEE
jgi:isopenicillin N synthase-like dioxygenase